MRELKHLSYLLGEEKDLGKPYSDLPVLNKFLKLIS